MVGIKDIKNGDFFFWKMRIYDFRDTNYVSLIETSWLLEDGDSALAFCYFVIIIPKKKGSLINLRHSKIPQ